MLDTMGKSRGRTALLMGAQMASRTLGGRYTVQDKIGTGGMATKLRAAEIATEHGCDMIITNGADPDCLYRIADGQAVGTRFVASKK